MNSEFTTIRSLIVLLFLIGLPIVAIMPEGVQGALKGFLPQEEADDTATNAPPARSGETVPSFPVLASPSQQSELPPVIRLADFQEPPESQPPVKPINWEVSSRLDPSVNAPQQPNDLPRPSDMLSTSEAPSGGMINANTTTIQAELDRLGATYYRLESWGSESRVYRFHCTVTIKIGMAEYSRRFESTAESPEGAMLAVRKEVQTWHDRFSSSEPEPLEPARQPLGI